MHDYNTVANLFDQRHICDLAEILINHGADPDKYHALTLHPLHYASLISSLCKQWLQEECELKNPCDGSLGMTSEVLLNHMECHDFMNDEDDETARKSFVEESFYNSISLADKIHHSFPDYVIDMEYFLNLYDQKGQTPLICAFDAQHFHINWKQNFDVLIDGGANIEEKEITSFNNGIPVYGENSIHKILGVNTNSNVFDICVNSPQHVLNSRKAIVEYFLSHGVDKDHVKQMAANNLFLTIQTKRALQENCETTDEKLENIDRLVEFWFEITVLLYDMPLVEAYQNFHYDVDNWLKGLVFGIDADKNETNNRAKFKSDQSQEHQTSGSQIYNESEDTSTSAKNTNQSSTENVCKNYAMKNEIPAAQFIIFPNTDGDLVIVDSEDEDIFWQYKCISSHFYQCNFCKEKNVEVTAHLKTLPTGEQYIVTNQIQHVCKIQNLTDTNRIVKQSDYEMDRNSEGVEDLTVIHPADKQWIYEYRYDNNLKTFYCVKCRENKHNVVTAFWKNKNEEKCIILSSHHICYILSKLSL
uniref:Uncharacterized protein n=1 Tax=Panagrolaimus sp. ES5 TaxID=591445 RepID=A0AC34FME6_9BILA